MLNSSPRNGTHGIFLIYQVWIRYSRIFADIVMFLKAYLRDFTEPLVAGDSLVITGVPHAAASDSNWFVWFG